MATGTLSCAWLERPGVITDYVTAQEVFVIKPLTILRIAGHHPQVVLLENEAVLSSLKGRGFAVPKGQPRIAQRFNAGFDAKRSRVPKGRQKFIPTPKPSAVPSGLGCPAGCFPALTRRAILKMSLRDKGTGRPALLPSKEPDSLRTPAATRLCAINSTAVLPGSLLAVQVEGEET
jgi:hypothetical protein